jgi:hypothetical protein
MKAPSTRLGQFCLGFCAEFLSFFIVVANTRAYTHGSYFWTAITDTLWSMQNFMMMKLMIDDPAGRSWWMGIGYTIGGTLGSLVAIAVTSHLGF